MLAPETKTPVRMATGEIASTFGGDYTRSFAEAIAAADIAPPEHIIADGRLHRFPANGRKGDDAGWYVLHGDGIPAGAFGDWRSGLSKTWRADIGRRLTPEEDTEYRRRIEGARRLAEEDRRRRAEHAAVIAARLWKEAKTAGADHPYLTRKGVAPSHTLREIDAAAFARIAGYSSQAGGETLQGRLLLVPIKVDGKLASLELIDEEGRKSALAGGTKKGGYWSPAPLPEQGRVIIAEGVATALSIRMATGAPVVACLSAGNIRPVANAMLARGFAPVIAADLDKESGKPFPLAEQAARELGLPLAHPVFQGDRRAEQTDFNDLHQAEGLEAVRAAIDDAVRVEPTPPRESAPEAVLTPLAGVEMNPVRWLWEGWLPKGKLTLLAGAPGSGKTTLAMHLAAVVSAGGVWPDGARCEAGDVVVWSAEDAVDDTLAPRLMAAGADLRRVHVIKAVTDPDGTRRPFDPATDIPTLRTAFASMRPAMLVVDPVVSGVAGDSHKNAEVRRGLQPLVDLAEEFGCAVLGITHTSKGTQGREPWERVTGSLAFAALARVVLFAAVNRNAEDNDLPPRLLTRAKSNLGHVDGGFGFDIEVAEPVMGIKASAIRWLDAVEGESRALLAQAERWTNPSKKAQTELEDAKRFLASLLSDGPLPVKRVIKAEADAAGYSWTRIRRAADALGVEKRKTGGAYGGKGAVWMWYLPQGDQNATRCSHKKDEHLVGEMSILCAGNDEVAL